MTGHLVGVRPPSDGEVVAESSGTPESFMLIYDRYVGELHGYLAARLGTAAADELAAAVFVRAFTSRRRYSRAGESVQLWLYGFATRIVARQRHREAQPFGAPPPTRAVVLRGRIQLRDAIATAPSRSGWFGSALIALAGVAAIVGAIVLTTQLGSSAEPRPLGPVPALGSQPRDVCGGVKPCRTSIPPTPRPALYPAGRTRS